MIRNFMHYYKPYIKLLIGVIIGTFAMAGLDLIFPVMVRELINRVLPSKNMTALFGDPQFCCCFISLNLLFLILYSIMDIL